MHDKTSAAGTVREQAVVCSHASHCNSNMNWNQVNSELGLRIYAKFHSLPRKDSKDS
jgi:hypothetical protein